MRPAHWLSLLTLTACGPDQLHEEVVEATVESALAGNATHRPHWGSARHGDAAGGVYASGKYPSWGAWKWPGCHATVGFYIDATVPTAWRPSIVASFASWDKGLLCSPHFVRATTAAAARIVIRRGFTSACDPNNDPAKIWYACAAMNSGDSVTFAQHWTITYNSDFSPAVGASGALDIESLTTVELAHVLHMGHNPNWTDSVSQANLGRWGDYVISAGNTGGEVADNSYTICPSDSTHTCGYRVCAARGQGGCGNLRPLKAGDTAFLQHLYAARPTGCTTTGQTSSCTKCCGAGNAGNLTKTCSATHTWVGTCVLPPPPPVDAGIKTDAGVATDAGIKTDAGVKLDAGTPIVDAGEAVDAGEEELDAGYEEETDAGEPEDAGFDPFGDEDAGEIYLVPLDQEPMGTPVDGVTVPTADATQMTGGCSAAPTSIFSALGLLALLALRKRR